MQLLRLPIPEFLSRCLRTEGVSPEHAQAFQSKFWKLHIDSQRSIAAKPAAGATKPGPGGNAGSRMELLDTSADPDLDATSIPFKERIRPGMVVSWDASSGQYAKFAVGGKSYAAVMCPVNGVGERVRDVSGVIVNPSSGEGHEAEGRGEAYLCAMVMPAMLPGSYGVNLWRQVVVKVEEMDGEVLMEWDEATRYYYLTV